MLAALAAIEGWVAAGRPPLRDFPLVRLAPSAVPHLAAAGVYIVGRLLVASLAREQSAPLSWYQAALAVDSLGALLAFAFCPAKLSCGQGLTHLDGGLPVFAAGRLTLAILYLVVSVVSVVSLPRRSAGATLGVLLFLSLPLAPSCVRWTSRTPIGTVPTSWNTAPTISSRTSTSSIGRSSNVGPAPRSRWRERRSLARGRPARGPSSGPSSPRRRGGLAQAARPRPRSEHSVAPSASGSPRRSGRSILRPVASLGTSLSPRGIRTRTSRPTSRARSADRR